MSGSWHIATIKGIDIKIHWTFIFILAYGAWTWSRISAAAEPGNAGAALMGGLYGVLLMLILFLFVALHELGHSLAARYYKIEVVDITLLPLGGLARIKEMPEDPGQEFAIAIAGPVVNLALTLILAPILGVVLGVQLLNGTQQFYSADSISLTGFLVYLVSANLLLALFNLIPALPLDGGRILRAVLASVMNYGRATRIAAMIGRVLAILLGIVGLATANFVLAAIALFIYFGAGYESADTTVRSTLREIRAGDSYDTRGVIVGPAQPVREVVDIAMRSSQTGFAVMVGNQLVGVVTTDQLAAALGRGDDDLAVGQIMIRDFPRVDAETNLYDVRRLIAETRVNVVAVFDERRYLGLINLADINEAYRLQQAAGSRRAVSPDQAPLAPQSGPRQGGKASPSTDGN